MNTKQSLLIFLMAGLFALNMKLFAQDQNFFIFLCFGQSNMEGQGAIQQQDQTVDSRFQVMEAVDCSNLGRTKGNWYTAVPPLCRCYSGLSPADYFGRKLAANLPSNIKVGVVNVSVAGCKIELFDKDDYQTYVETVEPWMKSIINEYGGNPYGRLVEIAKLAQNDGVIKGILLHQGESNTNDDQWPAKVKGVYDSLITDLALDPDMVPLLAGEVVNAAQGGICASVNSIIAQLPQTLPNSYIISSKGCTDATDNLHFNSAGYREIGKRYALKMLSLLGYEPMTYLEPECTTIGENWKIETDPLVSNGKYVTVKSGLNSVSSAPEDSSSGVYFPFAVSIDSTLLGDYSTVYIFARVNCASGSDDSFWVKIDDGEYVKCDGLTTSGWQWLKIGSYELTQGGHTLDFAYSEDGAKLDKICITKYDYAPTELGDEAENINEPGRITAVLSSGETINGYELGQNYPNPFNPTTVISYKLKVRSEVELRIYDILGREIVTLVNEVKNAGDYTIEWNGRNSADRRMSSGVYFYSFSVVPTTQRDRVLTDSRNGQSEKFTETKKLVLLK